MTPATASADSWGEIAVLGLSDMVLVAHGAVMTGVDISYAIQGVPLPRHWIWIEMILAVAQATVGLLIVNQGDEEFARWGIATLVSGALLGTHGLVSLISRNLPACDASS